MTRCLKELGKQPEGGAGGRRKEEEEEELISEHTHS
jgi:hypothetical protein